jgi:hypothetical protein
MPSCSQLKFLRFQSTRTSITLIVFFTNENLGAFLPRGRHPHMGAQKNSGAKVMKNVRVRKEINKKMHHCAKIDSI